MDNIIYNCLSKGNENIEIILPRRTPNATNKSKNEVSIQPVVETQIKMILNVATNKVPKLYIHGNDDKTKVSFSNTLELQANSINILTFTTVDGGNTWLVTRIGFDETYDEPKDPITVINNMKGPTIVLDATNIKMQGLEGPSIVDQFESVNRKITTLEQTVVSDVTNDVTIMLPEMIKLQVEGNSEILAEKI